MIEEQRSPALGEKMERVMGLPPGMVRLRPEKTTARPTAPADGKNTFGYDGPSDGYDRSKSGYDKPRTPDGQSNDRYDGPERGYDGPDPDRGTVKPPTPARR